MGGIVASLSLVMMLLTTALPVLMYVLPIMSGILLMLIVTELNKKWGLATYAAVSILSLLILPDKETAMVYAGFFGCYPVIKPVLDRLPKVLQWILKFLFFNAAVTVSYLIIIYVFSIPIEGMEGLGKWAIPLLLALGNVLFVLYDFLLSRLTLIYVKKWQKKFRSLFRIR